MKAGEKKMKKVGSKNKGFTLIELLIVVAIIGIIAGIAIPNFLGARTKARVTRAFADMRSIADALESYSMNNISYPADLNALTPDYITNLPNDPFGTADVPGYRYYTNAAADAPTTAWLLVSNGPDTDEDVIGDNIDWDARLAGQLGGPDGASSGYGFDWYDPVVGTTSDGDLGRGGP
jgi:general secretion pathway protein G